MDIDIIDIQDAIIRKDAYFSLKKMPTWRIQGFKDYET